MTDTQTAFDDRFSGAYTPPVEDVPGQQQPTPPIPGGSPAPGATPMDRAISGAESSMANERSTFLEQKSALAPHYAATQRAIEQPIPQPPTPQKIPQAPKPEDFQKNSLAFAGAMAVLGAVASRYTRMSGGATLAAFNGALQGWQAGNLQAYEMKSKEFEENAKRTVQNNAAELANYKSVLENRRLNIDQQMSEIQLVAAQYHDQMMFDAAQAKNFTMVAQLYQKKDEFGERTKLATEKLMETHRTNQQKAEQQATYWLSPEGQSRLAIPEGQPGALTAPQQAGVQQLIQVYGQGKQGTQTPEKIALQQFMKEHPDATAEQIQEFRNEGKQPRSGLGMAVAQFKKENPGASSADITNFIARYSGENSYQRSAGTMGARVENATNEVVQLIPQALETSRNLPRGKIVPINTLIQKYQAGTSDPAYNDFILANFSLINAYTRAMNPQGVPRVNDRLEQHAIGILSTATSPQAYEVQVQRLWKEVQASKTAVSQTSQGRSPGNINSPMPQPEPKAAPTAGHVEDGYRFKGGDPGDKANWERVQ